MTGQARDTGVAWRPDGDVRRPRGSMAAIPVPGEHGGAGRAGGRHFEQMAEAAGLDPARFAEALGRVADAACREAATLPAGSATARLLEIGARMAALSSDQPADLPRVGGLMVLLGVLTAAATPGQAAPLGDAPGDAPAERPGGAQEEAGPK